MKRILPIVLFMVSALSVQAQQMKTGFEIKIKIKGYSGSKMYLVNYYADKEMVKDSAVTKDKKGFFVFSSQTEPLPCGIYSAVNEEKNTKLFEFMVNTQEQYFSMETDSVNATDFMKVTGSEENKHFYEYQKFIGERGMNIYHAQEGLKRVGKTNPDSVAIYRGIIEKLQTEINDYRLDFMEKYPTSLTTRVFRMIKDVDVPEAPKNPDGTTDSLFAFRYYKTHFWDNVDFTEDCLLRTPIFYKKVERYIKDLTLQIPDSITATADVLIAKVRHLPEMFHYVVWWVTMDYERSQYMCMDAVPVYMWKTYYNWPEAYWVDSTSMSRIKDREKVLSKLLCGKVTPNLVMRDTSNTARELHKVKAKYTVLVFWDPDCSHCRKELPKIKKTYDELKQYGVEVYAVNVEGDIEKWKKFINDNKLDWINVIDPYHLTNFRYIYDINSTPIIYLLDENKKIVAKKMGGAQLDDILRNELKLPAKPADPNDKDDHHTP
ncbi:MAG: redoxin domain-containing protein [Bacteroidetes bacterium]|nr:MAG: redoxin domain-containing protein [Bacteroidota bacterium]